MADISDPYILTDATAFVYKMKVRDVARYCLPFGRESGEAEAAGISLRTCCWSVERLEDTLLPM